MNKEKLKEYLQSILLGSVTDVEIKKLGEGCVGTGFAVDYKLNGESQRKILKTLFTSNLGMDHFSDRAGSLILAHSHYSKIPGHVASLDVGGINLGGDIISIGKAKEFFLLLEEAQGKDMFQDFERIAKTNTLTLEDKKKIIDLSNFLVKLHAEKPTENIDSLYKRCIRSLIGGNTSLMSMIDMYPDNLEWVSPTEINQLLQSTILFWNKHRFSKKRLCHVHGDFHPGNIWSNPQGEFTLLDRSGQTYGEAADDLAAFSINFIFYSLKEKNTFSGAAKEGFDLFWQNYLQRTNDKEIMNIAPLFFALRVMVVANPVFYNDDFFGSTEKANNIRRKMFHFALDTITEQTINFKEIEKYF